MSRPMGVVFEDVASSPQRVEVVELIPGSTAARRYKVRPPMSPNPTAKHLAASVGRCSTKEGTEPLALH